MKKRWLIFRKFSWKLHSFPPKCFLKAIHPKTPLVWFFFCLCASAFGGDAPSKDKGKDFKKWERTKILNVPTNTFTRILCCFLFFFFYILAFVDGIRKLRKHKTWVEATGYEKPLFSATKAVHQNHLKQTLKKLRQWTTISVCKKCG